MLGTVLFELDGVLLDTRAAEHDAIVAVLRSEGVDVPDADSAAWPRIPWTAWSLEEAVRAAVNDRRAAGDPAATAFDETALALAILRAERGRDERLAAGVTLLPGAAGAVAALGTRYRLGTVTGLRRSVADAALALAGLDAALRFIIAPGDPARSAGHGATARSPHARRITDGVARLAARTPGGPATVAVLAATLDGIAAAHAAGARSVLMSATLPEGTALASLPAAHLPTLDGITPERLTTLLALPPTVAPSGQRTSR